jgi:hypothetical protein
MTYNRPMTERGNKGMKVLNTYHEPELLRKFKAACASEGDSMTKVVNELIKQYLQKREK